MIKNNTSISIVCPCFNEEEILSSSIQTLLSLLEQLSKKGLIDIETSRILLVDDGSTDNTWKILKEYALSNKNINCLKLTRNFGHQKALLAGILNSNQDMVVTIDVDLQDDIHVIEKMIIKSYEGCEIVYGVKIDQSSEGALKKIFSRGFYSLLSIFVPKAIPHHADFRLLTKRAVDSLKEFKEYNVYLRGIIPLLGYKSEIIEYAIKARSAGKTKYSFKKMISLALDGLTSFSLAPLRIIGLLGFIVALFSIILTLYYLYEAVFTNNTVPGWASTVLPIYFLGAVQLISLGIISEYIGKLFLESKKRPNFLIEEHLD